MGFGTKLKLYGVLFSVAGAVMTFRNSLSSAVVLMKASFVANETYVNYPLNPGYLSLSFPPKINLIYLVLACTVL